jgi:DNA adenine methylase
LKSPIKWVGGKRQLLPEILPRIPASYNNYHEPFFGGGSVFFSIADEKRKYYLTDSNQELINTYLTIRDNIDNLIIDLQKHINTEEYYHQIRSIDRSESFQNWGRVERASRFLFLNKTSFNALYRTNKQSQVNSPYGWYKNPNIVNEDHLRECSQFLQNKGIFEVGDFRSIESRVQTKDFVYLDPPYLPVSRTGSFTSYTAAGFNLTAQKELAALCDRITSKGAFFMLSNSATSELLKLYSNYRVKPHPR